MDTTIICPHCKRSIDISDAIRNQIADELHKAKAVQSETLRKEYDISLQQAIQNAIADTKQKAALENDRLRQETAAHCESEKELRAQISKLLEEVSKANKARDDAEITARKNLLAKEKEIREEAIKKHRKILIRKFGNRKKL